MAAVGEDVLAELLAAAKAKSGELPLKRLASQTLAAAFSSQYRATEAHLRALLVAASAELPAFPETFARVLRAKVPGFVASFASARTIALRLSCAVADAVLKAPDAPAAAWLGELLAAQSRLLEATLTDPERVSSLARKAVQKLLKTHEAELTPAYVAVITSAAPEEQHYQLWLALSESKALDTSTQEKLWTTFAFWAFENKTRTFAPLWKRDPRFAAMSYDQFDALVLPSMAKMLKKAPDGVLEVVGALVRAVPLDLGRYLVDVFQPVLLTKLRAQKNEVRALAVALGGALAHSFRQSEHMQQLVAAMAALLDGKHGILAQFYQREAAFAVLNDAADASATQLDASEVQEIAELAAKALLKAVGKEAHEQTRHLGLLALGKWLALTGTDELAADSVASLKTGLKGKAEAVVAGYLRTLAVLCQSRAAAAVPFADEVVAVISEANKKPNVVHLDGVLAVGVAGALASASSAMDSRMAQEGVAALLLSATSFVGSSVEALLSTVTSSSRENSAGPVLPEVTALTALPSALAWVLSSQQTEANEAYALLVELLCSACLEVRQSAERTVEAMYLSSLEHCAGLVLAFEKKLKTLAEKEAPAPPSGVLRRVLRVLVPAGVSGVDDVNTRVFAPALFLAHHPLLVEGKKPEAFGREWRQIRRHFLQPRATKTEDDEEEEPPSDEGLIDNFIEDHESVKTAIVELLANPTTGQLYSTSPRQRLAAQRTLATLLNFAGNGEGEDLALHDVIEELLTKRLDDEGVDTLSEEAVRVCQTPFDELYVAKKEGDEEEKDGSSSTRKKRGGRQGTEDEQWEQELREELERKKRAQQDGAVKSYTPEEKLLLAEQQALRQKVQETHRVVTTVLETLSMLAATRPDELHPALPYLLRSVRVLFTCPLFAREASDALLAMAKVICPELLRSHYQDVASALRVVLTLDQLSSEQAKAARLAEMQTLFLRLLAGFMEHVFGFQFESETDFDADAPSNLVPPPTLHLLFPVLRDLLRFAPDLRRWALPLFAVHARMIPEEEEEEIGDVAAQRLLRREMLELALALLAQQAAGDAVPITNADLAPGKLLSSLCMGPVLSANEWGPLLGDDGLLSEAAAARGECLDALLRVVEDEEGGEELRSAKPSPLLTSRLFCGRFDAEEKNRVLAKQVWEATGAAVTPLFAGPLLVLLN
ncbi:hypothetical protein BBJ28_00003106, partial [Nothophytophthora sp. Chile5]